MQIQQLHQLKSLCQALKPVVWIGQKGLSDNVLTEIDSALMHHELIKIKISATDKTKRKEIIGQICHKTDSQLVQSIGHMVSFYRRNKNKTKISFSDH